MKRINISFLFSFLFLLFVSIGLLSNAQTIVSGIKGTTPFITTNANATAAISNGAGVLRAPAAARGTITFGSVAGRGGFAADGRTATFTTAETKGEWVQWAITPAAGFDLNITGFTLRGLGTVASATNYYAVTYSIGDTAAFAGGTSIFLDSAGNAGNILYTTSTYLASGADTVGQNITVNNGTTLYLRVYLWGAAARTNTSLFTINNFVISGTAIATKATASTTNATICAGGSYLFNGTSYTTSGSYVYHTLNSVGADSAATLNLTVSAPASTTATNLTGCTGVTYKGITYTSPKVFTDTIRTLNGCDSIYNVVTISISCSPVISSFTPTTAANGDTVTIKGVNFTGTTNVSFGGTNATWFFVVNDTTLLATIGNGTTGDVYVTSAKGTGFVPGFTYNPANIIKGIKANTPFLNAGSNVTAAISNGSGILQVPTARAGTILFGTARRGFAAGTTTTTFDTANANNQYVQFAVSPSLGYNLNINSINIKGNGTVASATNYYAVAYAIGDSTLFNSGGGTFLDSAGNTGNVLYRTNGYLASGADTTGQNIAVKDGSTIYIRVYLWNAAARTNASQFTITNFTLSGTVTADATSSITNATICNGSSYLFNGSSYSTAGSYVAHLLNAGGSDSTAILKLKVTAPATSDTLNYINCTSVTYKKVSYKASTSFIDTVFSSIGCDSIYHSVNILISCSPAITSYFPTNAAIGDTISISGANFTGATLVSLGGTPASSFTVIADTLIQAIVGNGTTGDISITTPNGIVTATGFVYNTANIITGIKTATPFITAGKNVIAGITYGSGIVQAPAVARRTITFGTGRRSFAADGVAATFDTSNAKNEYVQFAISPVKGYKLDINGITLKGNGTVASTTNHYAVAYAVGDSTQFAKGTSTFLDSLGSAGNILNTTADYLVSGADTTGQSILVNNNSTLYLRVYLWNAAARTNTSQFTISTFTVYGSVTSAATSSSKDTSICAGTSITFNGITCDTAGTYTAHLTNSVGADSAAHLILTIKDTSTSITKASICMGRTYTFNGSTYSKAGTYSAHLTNAVGCDSLATLVLTIKDTSTSTTKASVCAGSSYTFNGNTYATAGTYTVHLTNAAGCDSTAYLVLSVIPLKTVSVSINPSATSICSGSPIIITANPTNGGTAPVYQWSVNGNVIPGYSLGSLAYTPQFSGQFVITCKLISNATGCLSADTVTSSVLPITVNPLVTPQVSIAVSPSYNPLVSTCARNYTFKATSNTTVASYQWSKNGIDIPQATSDSFTNEIMANGDTVVCTVAVTGGCLVTNSAIAKVGFNNIIPASTASISISSQVNGTTETFTAKTTNVSGTSMYKWYKNSVLVSYDTTYTDSALISGDSVWCVVINNMPCVVNPTDTSNVILVSNPLPISLTSFSAKVANNGTLLQWNTAKELSTASFIIESSKNGVSFNEVGSVSAKNNGIGSYNFTDRITTVGTLSYYRLKIVDKTGTYAYSNVVAVQLAASNFHLSVYPNPSRNTLTINGFHIASIEVVDNLGRVINTYYVKDATNPAINVNRLSTGMYHLRIQTTDGTINKVNFIKD